MGALIIVITWLSPIVIWAVKILVLYFVLKKAFYRALVKFHDTHGFSTFCEEPEETYDPAPEETASEQLPDQAQ